MTNQNLIRLFALAVSAGSLAASAEDSADNERQFDPQNQADQYEASQSERTRQRPRRGPPPFCVLDMDNDGLISMDEFTQHKIPRHDPQEIFKKIDSDGDGAISKQEWQAHKPTRQKRREMRS